MHGQNINDDAGSKY